MEGARGGPVYGHVSIARTVVLIVTVREGFWTYVFGEHGQKGDDPEKVAIGNHSKN